MHHLERFQPRKKFVTTLALNPQMEGLIPSGSIASRSDRRLLYVCIDKQFHVAFTGLPE